MEPGQAPGGESETAASGRAGPAGWTRAAAVWSVATAACSSADARSVSALSGGAGAEQQDCMAGTGRAPQSIASGCGQQAACAAISGDRQAAAGVSSHRTASVVTASLRNRSMLAQVYAAPPRASSGAVTGSCDDGHTPADAHRYFWGGSSSRRGKDLNHTSRDRDDALPLASLLCWVRVPWST